MKTMLLCSLLVLFPTVALADDAPAKDEKSEAGNLLKPTGTDWHVQAYQAGLDLKDGKDYVVKFKAKSPQKVSVLLVGQIHEEDWHEIGLHEEVRPGEEFEDFEFEFTAGDTVDKNNRI